MNFLNSRTFEIFRYLIPSSVLAIIIICFGFSKELVSDLLVMFKSNEAIGILLGLILLYVIGIMIDEVIYQFLKKFAFYKKRQSRRSYEGVNNLSISEKYSLVRQFSEKNYAYVEYWNALKGMCLNLLLSSSVGVILILFSFFYKLNGVELKIKITTLILLIIFSFLMYLRGNLYGDFADSELDSTVDVLKLKERSGETQK